MKPRLRHIILNEQAELTFHGHDKSNCILILHFVYIQATPRPLAIISGHIGIKSSLNLFDGFQRGVVGDGQFRALPPWKSIKNIVMAISCDWLTWICSDASYGPALSLQGEHSVQLSPGHPLGEKLWRINRTRGHIRPGKI